MLDLPNVTLLFVETRAHKITRRVILDCMSKVKFGDIRVFTDDPAAIGIDNIHYIGCADFQSKKMAGQFYYAEAMGAVQTDFALMLEWDAGIYDPGMWTDEFLRYDYVGAPWNVRAEEIGTMDVGNGGFTLMSKRLGQYIINNKQRFPVSTDWDLCRNQRKNYEAAGFKWPKRELAGRFSWELVTRNPLHFGYHGAFNWPLVLTPSEIIERAKIMLESPYLTNKMTDLISRGPAPATWLKDMIDPRLWARYETRQPSMRPTHRNSAHIIDPNRRQSMLKLLADRQAATLAAQSRGLKA